MGRWVVSLLVGVCALCWTVAAAATPSASGTPASAEWPTASVRLAPPPMPPARTVAAYVGGGYPGALHVAMAGELGLHALVALRAMAQSWLLLADGSPHARVALGAGPALVFDAIHWVPRLYAQVGVVSGPIAPTMAFGAELERYVGLRLSVRAALQASWLGSARLRGDAMVGIGYALF